jgi:uncharacterized radical SAM superfamily protein
MAPSYPEQIWNLTQTQLLELLNTQSDPPKPRRILFYAPSFMHYKTGQHQSTPHIFPTISITANKCSLQCKHCQNKLLETMHPVSTPQEFYELCIKLKQKGASGCLISGGCLPDGSLPLQKFVPAIEKIKLNLNLLVFVHTGIINQTNALLLKKAKIDAALIDVIGSNQTIREICNLKTTTKTYLNSLKALTKAEIPFIPHVVVGLHNGELKGELNALKMIAKSTPAAIVIISFLPLKNTPMANTNPANPADIAKVIVVARYMFPKTPIALGCMRAKGKQRAEIDILAIKAGADAVAFPTQEAIDFSKKQTYQTSFSPLCCAHIYKEFTQI